MAKITIKNLRKKYGNINALSDVSLDINDREFIVLFGPAGAGKTTLLSVIAGIIKSDGGTVLFDDRIVDDVEPNKRNVAMVFENYALYPHFNVYDNIASPMRSPEHKQNETHIETEIKRITKIMKIDHLLERFPSQVSNGQRQRIALGRALVRNPNVFLLDEPLAHLDAKLKNLMRTELKFIQQELNTTAIYVTHDYLEALSLADRIIIIDEGKILQVGTPDEVYYSPVDTFVARLIGEPEINLIEGPVANNCFFHKNKNSEFKIELPKSINSKLINKNKDNTFLLGIRGIDIKISLTAKKSFLPGKIYDFYSIGNRYVVEIEFGDLHLKSLLSSHKDPKVGDDIFFQIDAETVMFFDVESHALVFSSDGHKT